MRNVIEYFFGFIEKRELSNIFPPDLEDDKFHAFYRYVNKESHSISQNIFDTKEFDYSIFKEGLRLVFEKNGYSKHYKKMMKS
tara:strand:+ start:3250 stop:3498 length:249 start_codon:yes stop_codon:yes gene_type:complete